ncbi:hypothetical protein IV203_000585 [Nitzschia inconspicua]|uniref:Uncharacterized protein n=1 Tax=Nitzschia inconspicua TaxID=303405 RepID=A0A9K3L5T6_9STRA|nr:hypothetical protein IV203_000585 [Nitzschia inconspicua]
MTDVESRQSNNNNNSKRKNRNNNPYSDLPPLPPPRPRWHPLNILSKSAWMGGSLYLLHKFEAYSTIMKDPDISHTWFKIGLAASIALLMVKAYVELYTGKLQRKQVNYQTMPQSTHTAIALIVLSGMAFHVALWPVYGIRSMLIMLAVSIFLLNFCLLFPTSVQNIAAFAVLTFFLQQYK